MRAAARRRPVRSDPGQEVVDGAVHEVDRDPRLRSPSDTVGGRAHDDVVRRTTRAELAVLPDDVHPAGPVDFGRGQRMDAHAAVDEMLRLARNEDTRLPADAAVRRPERLDRAVVRRIRHNDGAVRLDDRLAAEPGRRRRGLGRAPRQAAVGRGGHHHLVPGTVVVPLRVAVAVVGARRPRVTGDPRLVPEAPRRLGGSDRVRPGQAAVGRAVDEQPEAGPARVDPEAEGEPDVVLRVVGDRRIADPGPGAALVDRRAGQAARDPRAPAVRRRREHVVAGAAPGEVPAGLRRGDDRLPEREGVRLDLRLVRRADVRVRVVADRERNDARSRDRRYEEQPESRCCGNRREASSPQPSLPHGVSILVPRSEKS